METLTITVRSEDLFDRIITPVTVRQAGQRGGETGIKTAHTRAMWDTGSTGCCISKKLAEYLELNRVDSWNLTSVHDSKRNGHACPVPS